MEFGVENNRFVNVEYLRLRDVDCSIPAYTISLKTDCKSFAKIQKNITVCVTVLSVFSNKCSRY
jgi:hypothetical protein